MSSQKIFRNFAHANLAQRTCNTYIKDQKAAGDSGICGCGHSKSWHEERGIQEGASGQVWKPDSHTVQSPTSAFGVVEFTGFGSKTESSPYARVDYKTEPEILWQLLHDVWRLPQPKLVVSVTGGAKQFYMKPRLLNAFKQGLIDIASTTDAWIITGGTATGVMKYVGEALLEYQMSSGMAADRRMVVIGIAAWGCIDNSDSLESQEGVGRFPTLYSLLDCVSTTEGAAPLDHNHTHFILVDNGTTRKYGTEINLRSHLESFIKNPTTETPRVYSEGTPVVLLVCEGGINTLQQTRDAVQGEVPVVVIKRSGRIADVIATAFRITRPHRQNEDVSYFPSRFDEEVKDCIVKTFGSSLSPEKLDDCLQQLRELLTNRTLITIFELDDDSCKDMDKAVLSALLRAKKSQPQSQVDLALIWNRADIARMQIFTVENRKHWQGIELDDAMHRALMQGRVDFVQLFLDNGVHLGNFMTIRRLHDLYLECLQEGGTTMSVITLSLIQRIKLFDKVSKLGLFSEDGDSQDSHLLHWIGKLIRYLLKDQIEDLYDHPNYVLQEAKSRANDVWPQPVNTRGSKLSLDRQEIPCPESHLFLWALLFNQTDIAKMMWKTTTDPIGGALIAARLLSSLANEAAHQQEIDLSQELEKEAKEYEARACGVLNTCYSLNKSLARLLLRRELAFWGKTTLFSLAESAQLMDFMQLTCSQTMLNQLWYGSMVDNTQDYKIMLVMFFPLLVSIIRFKSKQHAEKLMRQGNPVHVTMPTTITSETQRLLHSAEVNPEMFDEPQTTVTAKKRRTVSFALCGLPKAGPRAITYFQAIYLFYNAPITKFCLTTLSFSLFLGIFTYVVLSDLHPVHEHILSLPIIMERLLWVWASTVFAAEIHQMWNREARSFKYKLFHHFKGFWNKIDFIMLALILASFVLRMNGSADNQRRVKITYAISLMLAYLRFLELFYVSKTFGPKIIMIQKMLKDLGIFICILIVFVLSFGIAMEALLYPQQDFTWHLMFGAIYLPYWQMYGELFLDKAEGTTPDDRTCSNNSTELRLNPELHPCPEKFWLVPVLSAICMMLTNALLMNLLIAMFSYTFSVVQEKSEKVWRFYRYSVVYDYFVSPTLPPPLVVFSLANRMLGVLYQRLRGRHRCTSHGFTKAAVFISEVKLGSSEENLKLSLFEKAGLERFLAVTESESGEQMESKVTRTSERLEKVIEELEDIKEQLLGEPVPFELEKKDGDKVNKNENVQEFLQAWRTYKRR